MTRPLRTPRLALRAHTAGDAAAVHAIYSLACVQRYLGDGTRRVRSLAEARAKIAGWNRDHGPDPVLGVWAATEEGVVVGTVLLKPIPDSGTGALRDVEIGWHLHPGYWGRGYATEAARAVLEHGFAGGLERIVAVTHPANTASQAVCRRLEMRHTGLSNAYYDAVCELFERRAPGRGADGHDG